MKKLLIIIVAILAYAPLHAQNLFTDASGQSDLFIGNDPFGWVRFNTSSESVSLGYNHLRSAGYDFRNGHTRYRYFYGGDITVKSKEGIANVFKSKQLSPGFNVNGNFGVQTNNLGGNGNYMSLYLRGGIDYTSLVYMHNVSGAAGIDTVKKVNGKVLAVLNFQFNISHHRIIDNKDSIVSTYMFVGLSSGYQRVNNYADLDDVQASTFQFGNSLGTAVYANESGKLGTYESYNTVPINFDFAYTPRMFNSTTVGFNAYFRTNLFKKNNTANVGVGVYTSKSKEPSNIIGGLGWQFNDVGNTLQKKDNLVQRSTVFFYIGYSIK